jgi:hypothetical protein
VQNWRKVVVIRLVDNVRLSSPGGGTTWTYIPIDNPQIGSWGPTLEQITPYVNTTARTTNNEWKVVFYWSYDGSSWSGPYDLMSAISADGMTIHTPYSTVANFGIKMRFALGVRASTGTSSESVTVSADLAFQFRS